MKRLIIFVALFCTSCTLHPRYFAFEGVAAVESQDEDLIVAELVLHNSSADTITLRSGELVAKIKGDALLTLTLVSAVEIPPVGELRTESKWQLRRDDPTTIYAMRHRPIEHYLGKIGIDYQLSFARQGKSKTLKRKGLKASRLDINIEKILSQ